MNKGPDAYRTIGEASNEVGVEPYVLRFWETKFSQLRPVKRSGGRRFYRPSDIDKLKVIKSLLYDNGLTIKGAIEQLKKINTNEGLTNKEIIIQTNDGKDSLDIKHKIINELIEIRIFPLKTASVAQLGSALVWGTRGRGFKSRRSDQIAH